MKFDVNLPLHYLLWPWRKNPVLKWFSDKIHLDRAMWLLITIILIAFLVEALSLTNCDSTFSSDRYTPWFERLAQFTIGRFLANEVLWPMLVVSLINYRAANYIRKRRFMPLLLSDLSAREVGEALLAGDVMALTSLCLIQSLGIALFSLLLDVSGWVFPLTLLQGALNVLTIHACAWMAVAFVSETRFFPRLIFQTIGQGVILFIWLLLITGIVYGISTVWWAVSYTPQDTEPVYINSGTLKSFLSTALIIFPLVWIFTKWGMAAVYRRKFTERVETNPECLPG